MYDGYDDWFGQEAAPAPAAEAPAEGGGGGGADPNVVAGAIGSALNVANSAIGAVTGLVGRPDLISIVQTKVFIGAMTNWDRLEVELERARARYKSAVDWLQNPLNKKRWTSRKGRKGTKLCPPLYIPHPDFPPKPQPENPGGHVWGDPSCRCPTHKCAFKDSVQGMSTIKKAEAADRERAIYRIQHSREPFDRASYNIALAPNTGNIKTARNYALKAWSLLMSLDGMQSLFAAAGMPPWSPPNLTSKKTLLRLFPDDADAKKGIVPYEPAMRTLSLGASMYGLGKFPAGYTMPMWVYGFTPEEARALGPIGPSIAQVVAVQKQRGDRTMQQAFSGDSFGAPAVPNLRDELKGMITTGQIRNVPAAPPAAVPPAQVKAMVVAAQKGAALPKTEGGGFPWLLVGGGGLAAVLVGWLAGRK